MSIKKILCLVLALVLCGAAALAEPDLESANARIAELEAEVEKYKPYYDAQVIAEYTGGVIFRDAVMEEYELTASMYSQYGIDLVQYGYDAQIKQQIVQSLVRDAVTLQKAAEMGLDQLDEETQATLASEAEKNFETYIESVSSSMLENGYAEDTVRDSAISYLNENGYSQEQLLKELTDSAVKDRLRESVTSEVTVTEDDVKAAYDQKVADDETNYASDSAYTSARSSGAEILWNPEGYRAVKHVLIKFTDDQSTRYSELTKMISDLNAELEALDNPETTEAPADETAEATAEPETEAPRTREEIETDLAAAQADLDALYEELMPKAQEVVDKFNAGASFDELIDEYNEDPGMQNEPTKTEGYAVCAESTSWDTAFRDGAMSIESVGGISEPVRGSYGVHIIYYMSDVPAGAVAYEDVHDQVEADALNDAKDAAYETAVNLWLDEAAVTYHYDRL